MNEISSQPRAGQAACDAAPTPCDRQVADAVARKGDEGSSKRRSAAAVMP